MKPEIKQDWLKALRSGEYKQTKYVLEDTINDETKNCCLGVLCRILPDGKQASIYDFSETQDCSFPSHEILQKVELSIGTAETLAELNDDGYTFEQIADFIEKEL